MQLDDRRYGINVADIEQIVAMAELYSFPGIPKLLNGFLNLRGVAIPVIRLHRLFGVPAAPIGLWTPLIILRCRDLRLALQVDKVHRILNVSRHEIAPVPSGHVVNDCVEGIVRTAEESVLVVSASRLLLQQENQALAEQQQLAQERFREFEGQES